MTRDQDRVILLQQRLRGKWNPDGMCEYDGQGQLINLHLCGLELAHIPSEVWQFSSLQSLDLNNNRLSTLPGEIGQLTALQSLDLNSNKLSILPVEIGQLTALQSLRLDFNVLSALPVEIGQLTALQSLGLGFNVLSTLPVEIGRLTALQSLDLSNNELSTLPVEIIGQLTALQSLRLGGNRLSTLPVEIGQLTALQSLHLDNNRLSSLPAEIGQLTTLLELGLSHNKLSSLPMEIGQLAALLELGLSHNKLSSLPAEIGQLTTLLELDLSGNPLQTPPPETIARGIPAIFAYLRTIKVFYCYAHEDKELRDKIDKHLTLLKSNKQIITWHDRDIQPGSEWKKEIDAHLITSDIILLLVSADFLDSQYCNGLEMTIALGLHEEGKACVIPILLRDVDWKDAPFAKIEMLPTKAKPITEWNNEDTALKDVANGIRKVVRSLRTQRGGLWETTE